MKAIILLAILWLSPCIAADNDEQPPHLHRLILGVYLPGLNDEVNVSDIRAAMDYWLQILSKDWSVDSNHTEFFVDINEMVRSFNNKQLDMISAPPMTIIKHFNMKDLSDGFAGVIHTNEHENSLVLLVKNHPDITNLESLRGKRLLIERDDELSDIFIDTQTRKQFNQSYTQFFSSIIFHKKNSQMILDLFFDKAEAALVYSTTYDVMVELNPQIKSRTKILLSYPFKTKSYGFFHRDFMLDNTLTLTTFLQQNFDHFQEDPRLQQLLIMYKTDALRVARIEELAPFKTLYDEYLKYTSSKGKHK
ncbi:PhnD/SsuA/transferrin family substrate-binding protein [Methylomonas sp. AM2-LC]|uniref:PhnD/SsuA/transferrin family substrate-binding protein n=1 Tax=Methylomonas sp. AM2-LC TaxID=3153301 RepID=UPI003263ABE6